MTKQYVEGPTGRYSIENDPFVLKILVIAFVAIFVSFQHFYLLQRVLPILALILFFPKRRIPLLIGGSLIYAIFYSSYFVSPRLHSKFRYDLAFSPDSFWLHTGMNVLRIICLFAVYFVLKKLFQWLQRRFHIPYQFSVLTAGLVGFALIPRNFDIASQYFTWIGFFALLLIFFLKSIWFFGLYVSTRQGSEIRNLLYSIIPFWNGYNVSRERLDLSSYTPKTQQEELESLRSGLFLVLRALLAVYVLWAVNYCYFHYYLDQVYPFVNTGKWRLFGYEGYIFHMIFPKMSLFDKILFVFVWGNNLIFGLFYVFGDIFIGLARSCGFMLTEATQKPWLAKSFSDFMFRLMYYYSLIIIAFFYYPISRTLGKWVSSQTVKVGFSAFIAVFIGGLYVRSVRDLDIIVNSTQEAFLMHTATAFLPYFFFFGLATAFEKINGRVFETEDMDRERPNWPRLAVYHLLHIALLYLGQALR